jgi:hypothetical protein
MLMNAIKTAAVNNPARRALQRFYEVRSLTELGGRIDGGRALEVGCPPVRRRGRLRAPAGSSSQAGAR